MLLPFLLCVLILYVPLPLGAEATSWPVAVAGVALLVAVNAAIAWAGSGLALRLSNAPGGRGALAANRIFSALKGCVIGLVLAAVVAFKWPLLVQGLLGSHRWAILVPDLLLVLPALAMILTLMAFQHRFDRRRGRVSLSLGRCLWLRFRVEMAIILAPWLMLVLVTDVVAALFHGSQAAPVADSISSGLVLVFLLVFSPLLLRTIWATSPLPDGPLRQKLEAFCRSQRFRCHEILLWHTHSHLANAGVVGPTPILRYVLLTDALVEQCTNEEVEAVFAHEVGHIRHRHLVFYMLFAVAFVCFYANLVELVALSGWVRPLRDILAFQMTAEQGAIMLVLAAVYWVLIFGFFSRRIELEADLFSLQEAQDPAAFISALVKLAAMNTTHRSTSSWRHFSVERRLSFLRSVLNDPSRGARFRSRLALMRLALLALFVLALGRLLIFRPEIFGM
ncbi:MAG: M48 family metalloprotease [Candidatus Brocadiae bacterium]|nr:M48 family metalloprotease [Candidatus Brocadiia bacterium]